MIFPNHFTQTQRTVFSLEQLASNLGNAADAVRAVLAKTATESHLDEIKQHTTSDGYSLCFGTLDEVRCPSCGDMEWSLSFDTDGYCAKCQAHNAENRACPSCERWFPNAEFEHPFYCHQSDGTESETTELCRECLREQNESEGSAQKRGAPCRSNPEIRSYALRQPDGDDPQY